MAYQLIVSARMCFVPDGASGMSVPSAQSVGVIQAPITMPGGNTVSAGNLNTLGTNAGTALQTWLNANITQITNFATGGQ